MGYTCQHHLQRADCSVCEGSTSQPLNLDRHGMPKDFATYMWVTYKRRVDDDSPARRAFLSRPVRSALDYYFGSTRLELDA